MAYLEKAQQALESISLNKYVDWKLTTAYYAAYFSIYSILIKIGIKCEIHSCTIEFAKEYLTEHFSEQDLTFIKKALKARTDSQYYVDKAVPNEDFNDIIENSPAFFIKCKSVFLKLDENSIKTIRKKVSEKIKTIE